MNKPLLEIVCACVILAVFGGLAIYWQRKMVNGLPPRHVAPNQQAAVLTAYAAADGGRVYAVLGTGSMAPYIPAAPAGHDPLKTVVAFVVAVSGAKYSDIKSGDLVIYRAAWQTDIPSGVVCHQAASHDKDGWIMSGLHNAFYENWTRVTEDNFIGIVAETWTWTQ